MRLSIALTLFPIALGAVEVELDFTITSTLLKPSKAAVEYEIGTNPSNPATFVKYTSNVFYTGNLVASAEIDPATGNMETIEFVGGSIDTPNISASLNPKVGSVDYTAILSTNAIKRSPRSSIPDPLVGGVLNGTLHYTVFTAGSLTTTNYISLAPTFDPVTATIDLVNNPVPGGLYLIGPDLLFPQTLDIVQSGATPLENSFGASLKCLIDLNALIFPIQSQVRAAGLSNPFTHYYRESGDLYADATYTVPTAYGQWALDNELDLSTGEEVNQAGIPYALLYAFDLPADAPALPLTFSSHPDPTVTLDLPAGGLRFNVGVEYSPTLPDGFGPLPDENFLNGTDSLDAGKTADATLGYPAAGRGFLRFFVDLTPSA